MKFNIKKFRAKSYYYSIGDTQVPKYLEGYLIGCQSEYGRSKSFHIVEDFFDMAHGTNEVLEDTIEEIKDESNKSRG